MSESLPRYEVNISPCSVSRPELVHVRHKVPEGLEWDGRLTLARTVGEQADYPLPTSLRGGWVSGRTLITCSSSESDSSGVIFELATHTQSNCLATADAICSPCAPCLSFDPACAQRSDWVCQARGCVPDTSTEREVCDNLGVDRAAGWDELPATGPVFVLDHLEILGQGRGFDVDTACRGPGDCIDNSLWQVGQLANDQIRQGLLTGEILVLLELAGLDDPFAGTDGNLTLKWYAGKDADDPPFPANNFGLVRGDDRCCEFEIGPESVTGNSPQARTRAVGSIQRGHLQSLTAVGLSLPLTLGGPSLLPFQIERASVAGRVGSALDRVSDGSIGGAVPIRWLASTANPYCLTENPLCPRQLPESSTLIDLIASVLQPDVDLDVPRDGLERIDVGANGRVGRCIDGDGRQVPPVVEGEPWTCALDPRMADGYSIGIGFSAVPATIVGIGN